MTDETSSARLDSFPARPQPRAAVDWARRLRRLTINQRTTYRWSLLEEVVSCEQSGLGGLGLWRPKVSEFGEERAAELLRESGLAVSSLSWAGGFTGENDYSFDDAVADGLAALTLASDLGAATLIIVGGPRRNHTRGHARRLIIEGLQSLADDAAAAGVTLALEPMRSPEFESWTFLSTLDDALDVLETCGHKSVKLAFDLEHLGREPRLLGRLHEIVPWVGLVQWSGGCRGPRSGDAGAPVEAIVAGLLEGGYDGFFEIEAWSDAIWDSDYDELLARSAARFEGLCQTPQPPRG